jgi:hypothetical protein
MDNLWWWERGTCCGLGADRLHREYTITMTPQEMRTAFLSGATAVVGKAPDKVGNANVHLATMRLNPEKDLAADPLLHQARLELWPWLVNVLLQKNGVPSWFGYGTEVRVIERRWIPAKNDIEPPAYDDDEPIVEELCYRLEGDMPGVIPYRDPADTTCSGRILAVSMGPTTVDKVYWANNVDNIMRAIDMRITQKHRDMNLTAAEMIELKGIADVIVHDIQQDVSRVRNIATSLLFGDYASKKWSPKRAAQALESLMARWAPEYEFKANVKLEASKHGKPPRMIVADGDYGQVMSMFVLGTLERWYFKRYKHRSIKGGEKDAMMEKLAEEMHIRREDMFGGLHEKLHGTVIENDGSSWDTCMSHTLRQLVEVPILDKCVELLNEFVLPYNNWSDQFLRANTKKTYKVKAVTVVHLGGVVFDEDHVIHAAFKKRIGVVIAAIRRSGDRGTSLLNHIANMVLWCWVLGGRNGMHLVKKDAVKFTDIFGVCRRIKMKFEGDDSLLVTTGGFSDDQQQEVATRWERLGHWPKLFFRKERDVAEFTGYKFLVDEFGIVEGSDIPDVPRQLSNGMLTKAKEAVDAYVLGDMRAFAKAVIPSLIARAAPIAKRLPSVARFFMRIADEWADAGHCGVRSLTWTQDDLVRLDAFDVSMLPEAWKEETGDWKILQQTLRYEDFVAEVGARISNHLALQGGEGEWGYPVRLGWVRDEEEWNEFMLALDSVHFDTPPESLRYHLPDSMLP